MFEQQDHKVWHCMTPDCEQSNLHAAEMHILKKLAINHLSLIHNAAERNESHRFVKQSRKLKFLQ